MSIYKQIEVTQSRIDVCIQITYGTNLLPIELEIVDYTIPSGATAVAYAKGKSGKPKYQFCEINGNVILFIPEAGFFEPGRNELQIRLTFDNRNLFAYKCKVDCQDSFYGQDAEEKKHNPTAITELLTQKNMFFLITGEFSWDVFATQEPEENILPYKLTVDRTYAEIVEAINANKTPVLVTFIPFPVCLFVSDWDDAGKYIAFEDNRFSYGGIPYSYKAMIYNPDSEYDTYKNYENSISQFVNTDDALSETSQNPVMNWVMTKKFKEIETALGFYITDVAELLGGVK